MNTSLCLRLILLALFLAAMPVAAVAAPAAKATPAAPGLEAAPTDMVKMCDEVAREVEALRGWKFKEPVKKALCTPEFARGALAGQIDKQVPPEKMAASQAMLRMVGLLPPDCDLRKAYLDVLQEQAAGFYDTDTKTLYLVKRGGTASAAIDRIMIAHELTHALDDQHIDLDKWMKSFSGVSEDAVLVGSSVMEGSATALMTQYMTRAMTSGQLDMAEMLRYADEETKRSKVMAESPRYFTAMVGAYICGMNFLAKGHMMAMILQPDNHAVGENLEDVVKDPPKSMRQIIHPEKYWDTAARDEPVVVDDGAAENLLAAFIPSGVEKLKVVHKDTIGELLCAILTRPRDVAFDPMSASSADSWTTPAARGWIGDRFYLLAETDAKNKATHLDKSKGVWITFWETEKARDAFLKAYYWDTEQARVKAYKATSPAASPAPIITFGTLGNVATVFYFNFAEEEQNALQKKLESSPPPMLRGGKPWAPWAI